MKNKLIGLITVSLLSFSILSAQKNKGFEIKSLDSKIILDVEVGAKLQWSVQYNGQQIIAPSSVSLQLESGEGLGDNVKVLSSKADKLDNVITAINYKKSNIPDQCNQLIINCKGEYGVIFRVYNDGVAYRFFTKRKGELIVKNEEANFNFTADHKTFIPYMWDYRGGKIFNSSFEALYKEINISKFASDSLVFLPVLVDAGNNKKVVILEADLEDYPGMYLNINQTRKGFMGVYAPYPLEAQLGGYGGINYIPTKRADYIAKTDGTRNFPWRAIVISQEDKELLNNDMVQKLASPSRIVDISWIIPGQVAWDWWSDRNISHVDFKAGMNTPTYKYYIDFAATNKIKYIIIDGGWTKALDLTKILPEINLQEILDYGKQKGVDVIVWASWYAVTQQMDKVFPLYSKMGVKGFKIDFVDRDDQKAVASLYEIAKKAAEYHLLVDYHGVFKPTGLQRTYPNVIGFEGVKGLENYKWAIEDQPRYVVSIPFIRMMAGPMDYTPGAMRNSNKANYRPINSNPMSQGTRCQQLAMYVVFEAPLQMLSDNPTIYIKEQECTDFITGVPTTFDETVALDGKVGEYAALARKKGDTWFVGAMTNWTARELTLDFSFLGKGLYEATVFKDGINADRDGTDYKKEVVKISSDVKLKIQLAPGGGWAARIEKQGIATRLVVEGKPFLLISGELHNSTCGGFDYMRPVWKQLAKKNLNSVIATVSWELVEPEIGKFDFALVDSIIAGARKEDLKLVLIWFASWKNAGSIYMPGWVKRDYVKYPRARDENGKPLEILSTFGDASSEADAKAFAALMRHIKEVDAVQQTVVMIQVENEMGLLDNLGKTPGNARRDFSDRANNAYNGQVPKDLMDYLVAHKENLFPELYKVWKKNSFKTTGSWEEIFGKSEFRSDKKEWQFYSYYTEELFMAWNYARYVDKIAASGKKEYPLPMYVNAWLKQPFSYWPGRYPSGGPLPQVLDMWRAAAPSIDFIAPDIYMDEFTWVCKEYTRSGNPLFIPETRGGAVGAARALYVFGEYNAGCFAPFGIDNERFRSNDPLDETYAVLHNMSSVILENQGKGTMRGILVDTISRSQECELGDYQIRADLAGDRKPGIAGGLIIQTGKQEYIVAGKGLNVFFIPKDTSMRVAVDVLRESDVKPLCYCTITFLIQNLLNELVD